ncbi:glycosyltransferase family 4 protein [Planococcus sp. 1R117A]|uniref:glycosyltransferase family 4 protein n=1 Tax=Planococcus sp. 1R117A TaxID=3447020 RepID=UPI003EDBE362
MAIKVIHAVTIPLSLKLMKGQLAYLKREGYEVRAISSEGDYIQVFEGYEGAKVLTVNMERDISLIQDFKSLMACIRLFQKERPDIVNAGTPKAGLIVTLAAFLCRVPVRIYNVLGLRLETTGGLKRRILHAAEKIAATAATDVLAVSPSLKEQLISLGIAPEHKIRILGQGSYNGFDLESFKMTASLKSEIEQIRHATGLSSQHTVLGYVGRLTKDKGIDELVESFLYLHKTNPNLRLLVVGDFEEGDAVSHAAKTEIMENPHIIYKGYQHNPIPFYFLMDIFVFLTKREGFGNVSLEASLAGVPVLAADVTGARDTVIQGETGLLVDPENVNEVITQLDYLITNPDFRKQMGTQGKKWGEENFSNETIWHEMDDFYQKMLIERAGFIEETG